MSRKYCYKRYSHEWYLKNKDRIAERFKKNYLDPNFRDKKLNERIRYMEKWRRKAFEVLGKKCCKCGFEDVRALQFDHINGDGYLDNHKRNITHYKKIVISVKNNEGRYQVLCCNCNWIKRVENKEHFRARDKKRELIVNKIRSEIKQEPSLFSL
jgi:hypothetical protein